MMKPAVFAMALVAAGCASLPERNPARVWLAARSSEVDLVLVETEPSPY
jgi:hypothetical protein